MPDSLPDDKTSRIRADALRILHAGIAAANPAAAVRRALTLDGHTLAARSAGSVQLDPSGRLLVLGAGKAALEMARAAVEVLGDRVTAGSLTVPPGTGAADPGLPRSITVWEGGHPVPEIGGLAGAADALEIARSAGPQDVVICLLSGGASALWAAPAPGLTLDDLRKTTTALLRSGAPIGEINTVRRHLSAIAGGWLAKTAAPARVLTLAVQDVIGAGIEAIGSGPTLPDPTTYLDALDVIDRHGVELPLAAIHHLRSGAAGARPETPGQTDLGNILGFEVVLSIDDAVAGAATEASDLGYEVRVRSTELEGEAREVAERVAGEALRLREEAPSPTALLWGGETTVTVRGDGRGGRNQEIALAAALAIEGVDGVVVASMGTDGRDGPTDAAGGVVDGGTVARGSAAGVDARLHLERNDSYPYLVASGDLILIGPTGTNVNDLLLALIRP